MCLASNLNEDPQLSMCMMFPFKDNHFEIDLKTWLYRGRWSTQGDLCTSSSCWESQRKLNGSNAPWVFLNLKVITVICHSIWDVQPRRCCRFLHKYRIRAHWTDDDCRSMMSTYGRGCNLVCQRVGNSWDFDSRVLFDLFFQNWPVEQGRRTSLIVYRLSTGDTVGETVDEIRLM